MKAAERMLRDGMNLLRWGVLQSTVRTRVIFIVPALFSKRRARSTQAGLDSAFPH